MCKVIDNLKICACGTGLLRLYVSKYLYIRYLPIHTVVIAMLVVQVNFNIAEYALHPTRIVEKTGRQTIQFPTVSVCTSSPLQWFNWKSLHNETAAGVADVTDDLHSLQHMMANHPDQVTSNTHVNISDMIVS